MSDTRAKESELDKKLRLGFHEAIRKTAIGMWESKMEHALSLPAGDRRDWEVLKIKKELQKLGAGDAHQHSIGKSGNTTSSVLPPSPAQFIWKLKAVDLAVLFGILHEKNILLSSTGETLTREEFFDALSKLFISEKEKAFDGHNLRTQFDRHFDPVTGPRKKSVFSTLKKNLSNLQK